MKNAIDAILQSFLQRQLEEGLALAAASDLLRVRPMAGIPPFQYFAQFACKGLARSRSGDILEHDQWDIAIQFPPEYLRSPTHPSQLLAFLGGGERADLLPWHPNIRDCFICMEVTPGMTLAEILYGLFDLLTWRLYSTRDEGLNHAAAQWARNQPPERFPIDRRPLKRRAGGTFKVEQIAVHA
jgi:ubiquitin-protein ligase